MNANLDVLELIFARLDGADLVAAARVSRAFLAGAIPSLYARIEYTPRHAKRAQYQMSPFATLAAHGHLAVHVRHVAIHAAPAFQPTSSLVSPAFLSELADALRTATNLRSFVCTAKILPPLLPLLLDKHRLHHLRICAPLGHRQMSVLQHRTALHSLALDFPSVHVVGTLPKWTAAMQRTLAHLTLYMSQDTDPTVLNATLAQLPRLRGLHVIGCPGITHTTVLKALVHTPDLHELSFTIFPSRDSVLPPFNFPVPPLTHLSIDIRASYPGLQSLIARIIARVSPRDALAICGGWIGEIKGSSERPDVPPHAAAGNPPGNPALGGGGPFGQHFHGHVHPHAHGNDLPLLTPPNSHHGNPLPNPPPPPINPGNPNLFGFPFPFPFPIGNLNGDNDNDDNGNDPPGAGPLNLDINPDPDMPSLISSFPSTLSILHLPQISPTGLREVLDRCEGIQVLGIVMGSAFSSPASVKSSRVTGRSKGHAARQSARPEVSALAVILSRTRVLRELIVDTSAAHVYGHNIGLGTSAGAGGSHRTPFAGYALLTPASVRMLMRESPLLRRIVGEGRVWESPTPTPSSPVPFPHCLDIELTLTTANYGRGTGNNHAHGPPGFSTFGGGYGQMEGSNDHWFWLTDSASGGKVYNGI